MEKMISVKGNTLRYAREYYDVTIREVCEKTKIKEELLRNYEAGTDFPSYAQLEKLADYYNRPMFFFFFADQPITSNAQVAFRSIEKSCGEELSKHTRELIEKAEMYRTNLIELFENDTPACFRNLIGAYESDLDLIKKLRILLDLDLMKQKNFGRPELLLEYLRDQMFQMGIYVFKDSFKNDNISGLCTYDELFPVILINNKTSIKRQLFTLFHEVYHIILGEADIDYTNKNEETKCDHFASHFLIPQEDLQRQIEDIDDLEDIQYLDELARRYLVSRDALMYRLVQLDRLEWEFYREHCLGAFRVNSNSVGGNFYFTKMSYLGNAYLNKVFSSYYKGKISKPQVGIYTGLKTVHVSKLASKMIGGAF